MEGSTFSKFSNSVVDAINNNRGVTMTATILQYPADWQKFSITIATSGRVIEG